MHAIGKGVVVCEIQQSSNCTYRLYDYDRTDRYGNRRQLHVEKALEVMDYHRYELPQFQDETVVKDTYICRILSRCKYFECASYQIHGTAELTPSAVLYVSKEAELCTSRMKKCSFLWATASLFPVPEKKSGRRETAS